MKAASAGFDPALRGRPESDWARLLADQPDWAPHDRSLVVVSPHPDDEVLGAGGLMRIASGRGCRVTVIGVTDGEAAFPGWPGLGERRRGELDRALELLAGGSIHNIRLGIPDGAVAPRAARLKEAISAVCGSDATLVAPYERDGHPDHESVARVCHEVAGEGGLRLIRYPIWAWHHGSPAELTCLRIGRLPLDAATRAAKSAAIRCFTSQLAPGGSRPPILPAHVLCYFEREFEAFLL